MWLGDAGRTSMEAATILMNGKKYAEGTAKIVRLDSASRRQVPLPDIIAAPLKALAR